MSTATLGAVSGCSVVAEATDLRAETRTQNRRTQIAFHDGDKLFQVSITPRPDRRAYGQLVSLVTWQAEELRLDSFRCELRTSGTDDHETVTTMLETPNYEDVRFYRPPDDIHSSVLELEEAGRYGEGSIDFTLVLVSEADDPIDVDLVVTLDAELSDGTRFGPTYRATYLTEVDLPPF